MKKPDMNYEITLNIANDIIDTVREPLIILDKNLRIERANRSFYITFQVTQEFTEGQHIYDLGGGAWNISELRMLLEEMAHVQ